MDEQNPFIIDDNDLSGEWLRQAQLTRKIGVREADARHEYTMAKARLDVAEARLRMMIRAKPDQYGFGGKPTIDDVLAAIILQPEYQLALKELHDAKYAMDIAAAETTAMLDRRKALERRVELLGLEYWAEREPSAPSPMGRMAIEQRRRVAVRGETEPQPNGD